MGPVGCGVLVPTRRSQAAALSAGTRGHGPTARDSLGHGPAAASDWIVAQGVSWPVHADVTLFALERSRCELQPARSLLVLCERRRDYGSTLATTRSRSLRRVIYAAGGPESGPQLRTSRSGQALIAGVEHVAGLHFLLCLLESTLARAVDAIQLALTPRELLQLLAALGVIHRAVNRA